MISMEFVKYIRITPDIFIKHLPVQAIMRTDRRKTTELISLLILLSTCTVALSGVALAANTILEQNALRGITICLDSDPMNLSHENRCPDGLFSLRMSTDRCNGTTTYDVEGGEAYMLVSGDAEGITLKVSGEGSRMIDDMVVTVYEDGVKVCELNDLRKGAVCPTCIECDEVYTVKVTSVMGISYDEESDSWTGVLEGPMSTGGFSLSFTVDGIEREVRE